jgi:beta-lactamase regulating signal transducer with metallopeptidase domain
MDALAALQFAVVPALAAALLHALWQVALIGVAAALALHAMARWNAAARHTVAMGFLVAMLAAPMWVFVQALRGPAVEAGDFGSLLSLASHGANDAGAGAIDAFVQATSPIAAWVVVPWLLGVGVMLLRHVAGLRALSTMTHARHADLPPEWQARVESLRRTLGIAREVAVHVCVDLVVPCAARWLRPVVFVPAGLLARAPAEHLEALLAHELAHVARRDWLWNGVQCLVETVLFFHPAVWWLGKRIRQEREHACDDLAVAACGDALALAEALATLERDRHAALHAPLPTRALAATGGPLMQRVRRLLSVPPARARWGALAALGALSIGGALLAVQLGFAGGHFPDLQVSASTDGPLGPGDWRHIVADGVDKRREYRIQVDPRGNTTEVYEENGRSVPIDAATRKWIADVSRPVVIPPPPTMPAIGEDIAFNELIAQLSLDDTIVARLGAPVTATTAPVNGNVHIDGADGDADVVVELQGPKGRARFAVVADRRDNAWSVQRVAAR